MDIFDKIGNMASETYKFTAEKTTKIAREAKIKMKMNECKSKISDIYEKIGEIVYQHHVREEMKIEEDVEKYCQEIDGYSKQIEDYRIELLNLKDKKQCDGCYTEIDREDNFCPKCGKEQPQIEVKEAEIVDDEKEEVQQEEVVKEDNEN